MDKGREEHAKRRALEIYGIDFGPRTREFFVNSIQNNRAILLEKTSRTRGAFAVDYKDSWIPVIYDEKIKNIITFLPPEDLVPYQERLSGEKK